MRDYVPGPYDLDAMPEARAAAVLGELADWVEWLRRIYELDAIKPCWWRHPALVRELLAAFVRWRDAYQHGAAESAPFAWHSDVLRPLAARLGEITNMESCTPSGCGLRPSPPARDPELAVFLAQLADGTAALGDTLPTWEVGHERMLDLIDAGEAQSDDPGDPYAPVTYQGHQWAFDHNQAVFRRRI
ncbi:hypothetical protein [Tomitella cavernea]|uniref:DUF4913 domain-containing protein n=1 Tax=Tomitella cavernea TaxID=1387982 RepID=A0ABP9D5K7_9ACTN|nr:hypothetical protein [Tomitella cavernea]